MMASAPPSTVAYAAPRVLLIGTHYYPDAMEWHVLETLRHMGCPVQAFATDARFNAMPGPVRKAFIKTSHLLLREPERGVERSLLRVASDFAPSLVLVILGSQLSPKTVELLRGATRAPIVCWCQDQMTTLGRQYLLGAGYDTVFIKDRYLQDLFSRMIRSTSFHYLPEACNPKVHRSVELSAAERERFGCDVMIAGSLYYYRQEILRALDGLDLKMWGHVPDWLVMRLHGRHAGRMVYTDEKARAVAGARIALNTLHFGEIDALNCRAFELAGCGGFQLVTSTPVLAEHFTPDREVVAFRTVEELVDKVRHYLANPEAARAIARQGQQRAYREHTYEHRLREILRISLRRAASGDRNGGGAEGSAAAVTVAATPP